MERLIFDEEHEAFRKSCREFLAREVEPHYAQWEKDGYVPHWVYGKLADIGATQLDIPEEYGGAGETSYKFKVVLTEEMARAGTTLNSYGVAYSIVLQYLINIANDEQKARWFPGIASGETLLAIAMTEPGAGSDLAGISTRAERDGDGWVLNGAKTFITGASQADLVVVVARTAPPDPQDRRRGLSLFVVDTKDPGYAVGRRLDKIGLKSSDTCEISLTDVTVAAEDLLGEEGMAFRYLSQNLPRERLNIAVAACASAGAAIGHAAKYAQERAIFDQQLATFQNTKFVLAECATELAAAQALVDQAIEMDDAQTLSAVYAAQCKLFATEMAGRVIDRCLQIHGGYGYVLEYPIARLYADTRVNRIFGGSSEVMKTIIAKSVFA